MIVWCEGVLLHKTEGFLYVMVLIISALQISEIEVCCGFEKAYHMTKKHTTWSCGSMPYIPHDNYQMLYHVVCYQYQPWHKHNRVGGYIIFSVPPRFILFEVEQP